MIRQPHKDMRKQGATQHEVKAIMELFDIFEPCIQQQEDGRFMLGAGYGEKTMLGVYRVLENFYAETFAYGKRKRRE